MDPGLKAAASSNKASRLKRQLVSALIDSFLSRWQRLPSAAAEQACNCSCTEARNGDRLSRMCVNKTYYSSPPACPDPAASAHRAANGPEDPDGGRKIQALPTVGCTRGPVQLA